ncbi:hypothetical protein D3C86_1740870 [compost metagenome]
MSAELHGIGARLDDRNQRRVADALAQAVEGGGDGGRVMREVVVNSDAPDLRDDFHPALHAFEGTQRGDAHGRHDADVTGRR